jgi:hypothetical protein
MIFSVMKFEDGTSLCETLNMTMKACFRLMNCVGLTVILILSFFSPIEARANPEREFILSCTYGVLAGTLVGAASLAFVEKPGENLQHVARGASIGLYVGIGLGFYTAYVLPRQLEKEEERMIEGEDDQGQFGLPRFLIMPVASERGIDGFGAIFQLAQF